MIKKNSTISVLLFLVLSVTGMAQTFYQDPDYVRSAMDRFNNLNPFEETYLHTDRDCYAAGETIWFTAYLLAYPAYTISKNDAFAYVELLNHENHPVLRNIIRLNNGISSSGMFLPDTLSNGAYLLRAYTSVMKDYMPDGCFTKEITVVNPFNRRYFDFPKQPRNALGKPASVYLLPEYGKIIRDVVNRVAVISLDSHGNPAACAGQVTCGDSLVISSVIIDSTGVGYFDILPQDTTAYLFSTADRQIIARLPGIVTDGYGIHIESYGEGTLRAKLVSSASHNPWSDLPGLFIVRSHGKIVQCSVLGNKADTFEAVIPHGDGDGILNLAVTGRSGKLITERFVVSPSMPVSSPAINASRDKEGKFLIEVSIPGASFPAGQAGGSPVTVSVALDGDDATAVPAMTGLVSFSEVTPALPGIIYNDSFRRLPEEKTNLLLQCAHSIWADWDRILSARMAGHEPVREGRGRYIYITPVRKEEDTSRVIFLTTAGASPSFQYARPDSMGNYSFFIEAEDGAEKLMIKTESTDDAVFTIEDGFSDQYPPLIYPADTTPGLVTEYQKQISYINQVRKIYGLHDTLTADRAQNTIHSLKRFYGIPDQEIRLDDYISLSSVREIFFELVKRLAVRSSRKEGEYIIYDLILKRSPAMFIDFVPVTDATLILNMNPADILQIDVVHDDYMVGDIVFPGILNIITRKGGYDPGDRSGETVAIPFRISNDIPRFAGQPGDVKAKDNSRIPYFRNTLYWNPSEVTDSEGRITYTLNMPDNMADMIVTVSIINSNGEILTACKKVSSSGF